MTIQDAMKGIPGCKKGKYRLLVLVFLLNLSGAFAQDQAPPQDTLHLNTQQYEALFLKQNLVLLAERFNIDQAEAQVLQAKLWPNPNLSIDDLNVRAPSTPPFQRNPKNLQFSIQIEQLIQTAGKRKKQVAMEQVSVEIAQQQFEDLLRQLKLTLRNTLTQMLYLQNYKATFLQQQESVHVLVQSYQKQVALDLASQGEYIRLKGLQLELSKEITALTKEENEAETELKALLNLGGENIKLIVYEDDLVTKIGEIKSIPLRNVHALAEIHRSDLKIAYLENQQHTKRLAYEKAQKTPDFHLKGSYDRGGGIWPNFVGLGVGIDLPLFNRNQGSIRSAQAGIDQSQLLIREKHMRVQTEIDQGYRDLMNSIALYESIESSYEHDLDRLLANYTKNFLARNISMLEYLDFQNAYLENKKIIFESQRDIRIHFEELQFRTGTELK